MRCSRARRIISILSVLSVVSLAGSVGAEDVEDVWSLVVEPGLIFLNETANITVTGPSVTPFILTIKNDTLAEVYVKQFLLPATGNITYEYNPGVNGTFFVFIGDGEVYFAPPATLIVVSEDESAMPTIDELQDKRIDQLIRDGVYKSQIIAKLREWLWMFMSMTMFLIGCFLLTWIYYLRHLMQEHPSYWHRENPMTLIKTRMAASQPHPLKDGLRGWAKYFPFILASSTSEVDGFQHRPMKPQFFEEMMPSDVSDIMRGEPLPPRLRRVAVKFSFTCQMCELPYNRFGPETPCPHCGAIQEEDVDE